MQGIAYGIGLVPVMEFMKRLHRYYLCNVFASPAKTTNRTAGGVIEEM
jgi:hypothetical protein